jgi:hypothetical protein
MPWATAWWAAGAAGGPPAADDPDAVAQGYSPGLAWEDLAEAAYAVGRGAWHVASNLDKSLPTARGFAPGNGALVGAVTAATGVTPSSAGKPGPDMYRMAVERARASRPLVIGDRLDTDLAGARAAGFPGLHVLTGVSTARDAVLAEPGERPSFLGTDLRALLEPHPVPVRDGESWVCGAASARVEADAVRPLSGEGIDLVRAACAAAWASADAGTPVTEVPDLP